MRYALQILIRAGVLIGVLCAATYFFPAIQNQQFATSWWQENRIKLQSCMAGNGSDAIVITGTSLSANLPGSAFPGKYLNLSMVGGSPLTGLECLVRSGQKPSVVLVEMNWLDRGADRASIDWECNATLAWMRSRVPAFLAENQPLNLLAKVVDRFVSPLEPSPGLPVDPRFLELRIRHDEVEFQEPVDEEMLKANIRNASTLVSELRARGATVMLFESPVDSRLASTRRYLVIRAEVDRDFAASGVRRIPAYPGVLATSDGNHLRPDGLAAYAAFLGRQVALESSPQPSPR
jgi:hypothetical protein